VDLTLSPVLNVIQGDNAAGKTSLLEAIHCLARGRSFLPLRMDRIVSRDAEMLLVRGQVEVGEYRHRVGMSRSGGRTRMRLDGGDVGSLSEIAWLLPTQVINTQSQRLLTDGPGERRRFLNWGVFHVEHRFRDVWRRYDRAHRQRNAALRSGDVRVARACEPELLEAAETVDRLRREFLDAFLPVWGEQSSRWLPGVTLAVSYRRGWPKDTDLGGVLEGSRGREAELGYGLYGPHRADLRLLADGVEATAHLSRGQQKLLVISLRLALARLIAGNGSVRPVLLIDDLPAELDSGNRRRVLEECVAIGAQAFVTCIEAEGLVLPNTELSMFHVEQGAYRKVI